MKSDPPATLLYLELAGGEGASARLRAVLGAVAVEAILISPTPADQRDPRGLRDLVTLAQGRNVAALVEADAELAKSIEADGVHLPCSAMLEDDYARARRVMGPKDIVGIEASGSRHDAMALGEAGADYVAFRPGPGDPGGDGQIELVAWWAEIFEVPCVALGAVTVEQARDLATAGADFVGVRIDAGVSPEAGAARAKAFAEAIAQGAIGLAKTSSGGTR